MKQLTRQQMKNVRGGLLDDACTCTCSGSIPGSWYYTGGAQPSNTYLHNDLDTYCGSSSSGSCTNCTNWQ